MISNLEIGIMAMLIPYAIIGAYTYVGWVYNLIDDYYIRKEKK